MTSSTLIIFKEEFPSHSQEWWREFNLVIAPQSLKKRIINQGLSFLPLEDFVLSGSIIDASEFVRKLSLMRTKDGRLLSKSGNYKGYELWWIHYDDLMYRFALPYVQYAELLDFIRTASSVCLYKPPVPDLFRFFLDTHYVKYSLVNELGRRLPWGIIIQVILSVLFLPWAKVRLPEVMVWGSDLFDPPRDHDFRLRFIYEELRKKRIRFVEFIRSMEGSATVLNHALRRKRPVIYSFAIKKLCQALSSLLDRKYKKMVSLLVPANNLNAEERFHFAVAKNYLSGLAGDIWTIEALAFILRFLGVKAVIIPAALSRNFPEVIAAKICGVPTVGILHGVSSKNYNIYDFMPEFSGEKSLSLDKYGVWSDWWKEYYLKYSKIYPADKLHVSGLMRPLLEKAHTYSFNNSPQVPINVLFVSEQLAHPVEVAPYLDALLEDPDMDVYLKVRSYRDGFEDWLRINRPDILEKIGSKKLLRESVEKALAFSDVVVGSHSTAVLESVLKLKPFVLFHTKKWGDYFELESYPSDPKIFVRSPEELLSSVKRIHFLKEADILALRTRFFGDPYRNGSQWVVEEVIKYL